MPKGIKYLCERLPKSKINKLCEKMAMCDWERELCLEYLCEPKLKTIEGLECSDRNNYMKRMINLEKRIFLFLADNPSFLGINFLYTFFLLNIKKIT